LNTAKGGLLYDDKNIATTGIEKNIKNTHLRIIFIIIAI
jgi:hypothetical protein